MIMIGRWIFDLSFVIFAIFLQVDVLMNYLLTILDTPTKLDLLQDVRLLLHPVHRPMFDSLAPYQKMANPPAGFEKSVR